MDWFRSWHGAPTDIKWMLVGKRAKAKPGVVSAITWALFDHASQSADRGDVSTFDIEAYAIWSGFEEDEIANVMDQMVKAGVIVDGRLCNWDKRQPVREDRTAAERQRRRRTKAKNQDVTQSHAVTGVTSRQVTADRTEQNRTDSPSQCREDSESESGIPPLDDNLEHGCAWDDFAPHGREVA